MTSSETAQVALTSKPVFAGIEKVKEMLSSLEDVMNTTPKTNGILAGFSKNVKEETDIPTLIKMLSSVKARARDYNTAGDALIKAGVLSAYKSFTLEGATEEQWEEDITSRIKQAQYKEKYDKLVKIKQGFEEQMDREDKLMLLTAQLNEL